MAAWILILFFVTFATPYVADWMTEHTGLDTRIEKNCKEKLQNAVAGEEKSTEEQNTQEQKDLSGLGMKLPANVWNQIGDTHKLADGWMEQRGLYNTIASKASSLAMKAIAFVIVMLITVIAFHPVSYTHLDVYKRQVYIIDEVHMLSAGAFNALLKTLEEPPAYVIFILATTEAHKIPITILSRCQRYDFHRISIDTITDRLAELMRTEQVDVEERALRYVAKAGDGSMRCLLYTSRCVSETG